MSTSRDTITSRTKSSEDLQVTSFYGGADRGKCIQLTQHKDYIQYISVDKEQAIKLIADLAGWLVEDLDAAGRTRLDQVLASADARLPERWKS